MANLSSLYSQHQGLSEEDQKKAGQAIAGDMPEDHRKFVENLRKLIDSGEIDVHQTETFLRKEVCDNLIPEQRAQVDLAIVNIADLIRHIDEFYKSEKTPNESPQLQTMIEQAWQMTRRIEDRCGDVFKF